MTHSCSVPDFLTGDHKSQGSQVIHGGQGQGRQGRQQSNGSQGSIGSHPLYIECLDV